MPLNRKIRYGMVGGGPDAFIGAVHRKAAALDGEKSTSSLARSHHHPKNLTNKALNSSLTQTESMALTTKWQKKRVNCPKANALISFRS